MTLPTLVKNPAGTDSIVFYEESWDFYEAMLRDHCYWVANAGAICGVKRLDLTVHPPPDLVIEVDVTHSVVDRDSMYGALGVPEKWHYD